MGRALRGHGSGPIQDRQATRGSARAISKGDEVKEGIAAKISSDLRARAVYLPPCPLCSFIGVYEFPDMVRGPSHRSFRGQHKLDPCCTLSAGCDWKESQGEVAKWWREKRQQEINTCIATEGRRKNCMVKLLAANLEPLEVYLRNEPAATEGALNAAPASLTFRTNTKTP